MQGFLRWMRFVLPNPWCLVAIAPIALMYVAIEMTELRFSRAGIMTSEVLLPFRAQMAAVLAGLYGAYRAIIFHPLRSTQYRRWLEQTPWTYRHPLPAGPILPVLQDVVVLFVLMASLRSVSIWLLLVPLAMIGGYVLILAVINLILGEWALTYASLAIVIPSMHFYPDWWWGLVPAVAVLGLMLWATHRTLRRFPWQFDHHPLQQILEPQAHSTRRICDPRIGYPYDLLAPKPPELIVLKHHGFCLALLVGWLQFHVMLIQQQRSPYLFRELYLQWLFWPFIGAIFYLIAAIQNHWSPISLWGRLRTGRWIIWHFDRIWVLPLLSLPISLGFHASLQIPLASLGTSLALVWLLVVCPHIGRWQLTAPVRISYLGATKSQFVQTQ